MALEAIGFLELNSIARGIEAADRILKTADTRLLYAKQAVLANTRCSSPGRWRR